MGISRISTSDYWSLGGNVSAGWGDTRVLCVDSYGLGGESGVGWVIFLGIDGGTDPFFFNIMSLSIIFFW